MKVIVTGGAGFIGSAVVRHILSETDNHVLTVDALTYAATPEAIGVPEGHQRHVLVVADIRNRNALARIFAEHQPDALMHLAAESHVDRSIDGPGVFMETNVLGTYNLLETARAYLQRQETGRQSRFRFHHVSTDEVFGSLVEGEPAFTEETPYRPNSPYSASKAAADHIVRAWGKTFGLPVLISNCSNNYGPWQHPEKLIPTIIINALEGHPLPVYGDGRNIRDWLHVDDHARALVLILQKGQPGETYAVGGEMEMRNIDLVRRICAILDDRRPAEAPHNRLISFVRDRPGHDRRYAIDATKIKRELGWGPRKTAASGLPDTVDWYLANEAWWRKKRAVTAHGRQTD